VRLVRFSSDPALTAAITRFIQDHAGARTILFDLRGNSGGTTKPTDTILPFLFPRRTPLLRFDVRASAAARMGGLPQSLSERDLPSRGDVLTREYYVVPHRSERRLFDATVFVLTSRRTASAAEHFAFALQASGRARVIGETSAGAGNYSFFGYEPVGTAFRAFVPNGRPYDPRTGRGWEVTGVTPDVPVPANAALREALVRSGLRPGEAERIAADIPCATPTFTMTRSGG
jgi:C-terminal processing protease CtpA/Prc